MVRKTASNGTAAGKTVATKAASARKTARGKSAVAKTASSSTEIKPRRAALVDSAKKLKSPKVLVPLAVVVGVGLAAVRKVLNSSSSTTKTLPRLAKEVSPRFSEAVQALAELGRELRAKIR